MTQAHDHVSQADRANHQPGSFAFSPPTEGFPGWLALADPDGPIDLVRLFPGVDVLVETSSAAFSEALSVVEPRLVVLIAPPAGPGDLQRVASWLGGHNESRAVLLSPHLSVAARLHALELGFDDAVDLSSDPMEVVGRLSIAGRRGPGGGHLSDDRITVGEGVELDRRAHAIRRDGHLISLRPKELALLEFLAVHPGRAFTREELLKHVWHDAVRHERMVDVYVFWLRSKIERDPAGPVHLVTVRGSGYLFDPPRTPAVDPAGYDATPGGWPRGRPTLTRRQHGVKRRLRSSDRNLGAGWTHPVAQPRGDTELLNGTRRFGALAIAAALFASACSSAGASPTPTPAATPAPATPAATPAAMDTSSAAPATPAATPAPVSYTYRCSKGDGTLSGAGATFPYPLYSKWGADYNTKCGVKLNYQSIGSGGGVKGWQQNTVDFGASDAFLADSEITAAAKNGEPVEIPVAFGAVVVAYNLKGLSAPLKMTADMIAGIFDGKIKKWNDPAIAAANSGVTLPSTDISVVHRSDGSGTTSIFTTYLTLTSPDWVTTIGKGDKTKSAGKTVTWPVGLGASGNEGVTQGINQTDGGVGYIELQYALSNKIPFADVQNSSGTWITPSLASVVAAANLPSYPADLRFNLANSPVASGYPISGSTWLIVYKDLSKVMKSQDRANALVDYLWWAIHEGQNDNAGLNYASIPANLLPQDEAAVKSINWAGTPLLP